MTVKEHVEVSAVNPAPDVSNPVRVINVPVKVPGAVYASPPGRYRGDFGPGGVTASGALQAEIRVRNAAVMNIFMVAYLFELPITLNNEGPKKSQDAAVVLAALTTELYMDAHVLL